MSYRTRLSFVWPVLVTFCTLVPVMASMYTIAFNKYNYLYQAITMNNYTVRMDMVAAVSNNFLRYFYMNNAGGCRTHFYDSSAVLSNGQNTSYMSIYYINRIVSILDAYNEVRSLLLMHIE